MVGIALTGTPWDGIPIFGMTKEKYNENDNENRSPGENFRDDPFRGCGQPGGIDAGVRSAEHPALIAVGDC